MTGKPSIDEWHALYKAADEFRALHCWAWMTDSILWGVENPETGEIGWCCVLGNLGQLVGLLMYRGPRGLASWMRLHERQSKAKGDESALNQDCLSLTYGDRAELRPEDLKTIQALGLKYRGAGEWPQFRDYLPGYFPWFLDASGVRALTLALRTAPLVAPRARENPGFCLSPDRKSLLVFTPLPGNVAWSERWQPIPFKEMSALTIAPKVPFSVPDDVARLNIGPQVACELDLVTLFHPAVDKKGERPILPRLLMLVEPKSGFIFGVHMFSPADPENAIRDFLCKTFKEQGGIPGIFLVVQKAVEELLEPFAVQLGLQVSLVQTLPAFRKAQRELEKHTMR